MQMEVVMLWLGLAQKPLALALLGLSDALKRWLCDILYTAGSQAWSSPQYWEVFMYGK